MILNIGGSENLPIKVSCIIPAFNAEAYIGRAISSALSTPGVFELIIIDDGSQDDTALIAENIAKTSSCKIQVIRQENNGPSCARNIGLRIARADWVVFLDADDALLPEAVTSKIDHLEKCAHPETVIGIFGTFIRSTTGKHDVFAETFNDSDVNRIGRHGGIPGGCGSYLFRRDDLLSIGGFREDLRIFEDFELILRLKSKGGRIVGCNRPGYTRHYVPGSLTRGASFQTQLHAERRFLRLAWQGRLLNRGEIIKRYKSNFARTVFYSLFKKSPAAYYA